MRPSTRTTVVVLSGLVALAGCAAPPFETGTPAPTRPSQTGRGPTLPPVPVPGSTDPDIQAPAPAPLPKAHTE